jgi:release factor glutamine methyltransferase
MHTWRKILELSCGYLESHAVPDAMVAAELLMARLVKSSRGFLTSHLDKIPDQRLVEAMRRGISRLSAGEPIQYVLGEWDFRSLTLKCDKRALIPRPETEELVTRILKFSRARNFTTPPFVVDVGTGSGCIIISLAKEMPSGVFLGIDISPDAISLAKENVQLCGISEKVKFAISDGLDDFDEPGIIDIIVSNPPYITTEDCKTLDPRVRNWEPMSALDGGVRGLDFYERLSSDAFNLLKPNGAVFFEIGDGQGEDVRNILFEAGFDDITIEKDYAGHDRYASAILSH